MSHPAALGEQYENQTNTTVQIPMQMLNSMASDGNWDACCEEINANR